MAKLQKRLGKRISHLRCKADLTQAAFAEMANVSNDTISRIERGERSPSFAVLERIAKALNTEVCDLFNFTNRKFLKRKWSAEFIEMINYLDGKTQDEIGMIHKISQIIFEQKDCKSKR
jgi:transcriptional regulator with XRE-family HTH domain